MANSYFQFKQFRIHQDRSAMKVTTDGCLFGAWCARELKNNLPESQNLLDIGTGTGLLSLMIAQLNSAHIDAVEIEPGAAAQARENIALSPWSNKIELIEEDILSYKGDAYDGIIINPPFYENELASVESKKNIAHHSALLTLKELVPLVKARLSPNGLFFLLLPFKRLREAEQAMKENELFLHKKLLVKQSVHHSFFRVFFMGGHEAQMQTETLELAIRDEAQNYTPEFTALLKDYYLYL